MIRRAALGAALAAVGLDLAGALLDWRDGAAQISLHIAAFVTALALAPCAIAFLVALADRMRRPLRAQNWQTIDTMRLPLVVPRVYVGAAVLGGIATLAAMGEGFGLFIFLAGIALIALALSQAEQRRA